MRVGGGKRERARFREREGEEARRFVQDPISGPDPGDAVDVEEEKQQENEKE